MGIFDNANDLLNRNSAKVNRAAKSAFLKSQLKDLERQRSGACARLGEALYPLFDENPEIRNSHLALFTCIDDLDKQMNEIRYDLAAIEKQGTITSSVGEVCPKCGLSLSSDDSFCPGCGNPIQQTSIPINPTEGCCPKCGTELENDQAFCMRCGTKIR